MCIIYKKLNYPPYYLKTLSVKGKNKKGTEDGDIREGNSCTKRNFRLLVSADSDSKKLLLFFFLHPNIQRDMLA